MDGTASLFKASIAIFASVSKNFRYDCGASCPPRTPNLTLWSPTHNFALAARRNRRALYRQRLRFVVASPARADLRAWRLVRYTGRMMVTVADCQAMANDAQKAIAVVESMKGAYSQVMALQK